MPNHDLEDVELEEEREGCGCVWLVITVVALIIIGVILRLLGV